jgi:hypothetical protein
VDHTRRSGVRELSPDLVQQWVAYVEVADLDVHLEDLHALLDPVSDVGGGLLLGVEGRRVQALGNIDGQRHSMPFSRRPSACSFSRFA